MRSVLAGLTMYVILRGTAFLPEALGAAGVAASSGLRFAEPTETASFASLAAAVAVGIGLRAEARSWTEMTGDDQGVAARRLRIERTAELLSIGIAFGGWYVLLPRFVANAAQGRVDFLEIFGGIAGVTLALVLAVDACVIASQLSLEAELRQERLRRTLRRIEHTQAELLPGAPSPAQRRGSRWAFWIGLLLALATAGSLTWVALGCPPLVDRSLPRLGIFVSALAQIWSFPLVWRGAVQDLAFGGGVRPGQVWGEGVLMAALPIFTGLITFQALILVRLPEDLSGWMVVTCISAISAFTSPLLVGFLLLPIVSSRTAPLHTSAWRVLDRESQATSRILQQREGEREPAEWRALAASFIPVAGWALVSLRVQRSRARRDERLPPLLRWAAGIAVALPVLLVLLLTIGRVLAA